MDERTKKHLHEVFKAQELGKKMIELMASEGVLCRIRQNYPGWISPEMKCMKLQGANQPVHAWVKLVKLPKVLVLYGQGRTATDAVYNALEQNYGQLVMPEEPLEDLPF
jgi:hypothetical protein